MKLDKGLFFSYFNGYWQPQVVRFRAFISGIKPFAITVSGQLEESAKYLQSCYVVVRNKAVFQFFYRKLQFKNLVLIRSWRLTEAYAEDIFAVIYYILVFSVGYSLVFKAATLIDEDSFSTFAISSGAMIGGMLAILFSILTLSVQNAAEKFSAGFFNILAQDKIQNLTFYILGLFSIILLVSGLTLPSSLIHLEIPAFILIMIVGISIHLLYASYCRFIKRIDPSEGLIMVQNKALNKLSSIRRQVEDAAKVMMKKPDNKESEKTCLAVAFMALKDHLIDIDQSLEFLFDLHGKYLLSSEKSMALGTLQVIRNILVRYVSYRSDCSISVASPLALLATTSDSHGFLNPNLESLVATGSAYIRNHDDNGATKVINIFRDLALTAVKTKYIGSAMGNPLFSQISGYLQTFVGIAVTEKSPEIMFQGVNAITSLALAATDARLDTEVLELSNKLFDISVKTFNLPDEEDRKRIVYQYALSGQLRILIRLVEIDHNLEVNLKIILDRISAMIKYGLILVVKGGIDANLFTQTVLSVPFTSMKDLLIQSINQTNQERDPENQRKKKHVVKSLSEQFYMTLRLLPEKIKCADHLLTRNMAEAIGEMAVAQLRASQLPEWVGDRFNIAHQSISYMHILGFMVTETESFDSNLQFDEIIESVTKFGIAAVQIGNIEAVKKSIETLSLITMQSFKKEKESYGYTEPRIVERACFIGILALKHGQREVVDLLKIKIAEFQAEYENKWFSDPEFQPTSPTKGQLENELYLFRENIYQERDRSFGDRSSNILASLIEEIDVDRFTFEIWGSFPSGSPLEQELGITEGE